MLQHFFCFQEIGIEAEDFFYIQSCFFRLSRFAKTSGEGHADAAFARGTVECVLPERDGAAQVSGLCFDDSEVRGCVDKCRVERERFLIKLASVADGAVSQLNERQSG